MWNRLSVIFILLFAASIASAQLANFKGGLEAGVMGTQVDGDTLSGYDKAGLRVGGFIEKPVTEEISVQFAMVYTQKGSQGEKKVDDPFSFYEINLHYVDMPLTARYYH
ncbi:MAG TPA: outer membrane beta-barrel protein, partial [Salinivirga sp.]|uniref:outer membrane beta-barrel protein n=1 Tax=Salinivirga sp. TaxID=1970192 RepID=UPI002B47208D